MNLRQRRSDDLEFSNSDIKFNPLKSALHPSWQRPLPRLLLGILVLKGLIARRLYKSFEVRGLIRIKVSEINV
jgi:hypothetical protein